MDTTKVFLKKLLSYLYKPLKRVLKLFDILEDPIKKDVYGNH